MSDVSGIHGSHIGGHHEKKDFKEGLGDTTAASIAMFGVQHSPADIARIDREYNKSHPIQFG